MDKTDMWVVFAAAALQGIVTKEGTGYKEQKKVQIEYVSHYADLMILEVQKRAWE